MITVVIAFSAGKGVVEPAKGPDKSAGVGR